MSLKTVTGATKDRYVPQLHTNTESLSTEQKNWKAYLKALTTEEEYEVLDCIATKESRWQMKWNYMHDIDPSKYTAYGIFQILKSTAYSTNPSLDRMEPFQNIQLGVELYRRSGASPWLVAPQCVTL